MSLHRLNEHYEALNILTILISTLEDSLFGDYRILQRRLRLLENQVAETQANRSPIDQHTVTRLGAGISGFALCFSFDLLELFLVHFQGFLRSSRVLRRLVFPPIASESGEPKRQSATGPYYIPAARVKRR